MIRQKHQKSVFNDIDQPKISARMRCVSSNQSNMNQSKSIKKQCSNKFLRPFSPKKHNNYQQSLNKKINSNNDENGQNIFNDNYLCIIEDEGIPSSQRALKTIDQNQNINRKNNQPNKKTLFNTQKPIKNEHNLIQKFQSNETKIILMRQQLQKVFETFKERQKEIQQKKSLLKNTDKIKGQNQFLSKQIARVQQMIKQALLQRQKQKHGPLSRRTNR